MSMAHWGGVDRTGQVMSTKLKPTGAFGRPRVVGGAWRPPQGEEFGLLGAPAAKE